MNLYDEACLECSKVITLKYSTSFSSGISAFSKQYRYPIYAVYGFVRCADEIVDTFHDKDKKQLITNFRRETFEAIDQGISNNPILHAFQLTVNRYKMDTGLIDIFLSSMEVDLTKTVHDKASYNDYIFGSAEVIGLMCLSVFCDGDRELYNRLQPHARSLGAAFQKVNFLRDMRADLEERGRIYFPDIDFNHFSEADKRLIEQDVNKDFEDGLRGIKLLPKGARLGVYIAYSYYLQLYRNISQTPAPKLLQQRIRVSDSRKLSLYFKAVLQQKLNFI
jgi:phytoene/squalene synthetase